MTNKRNKLCARSNTIVHHVRRFFVVFPCDVCDTVAQSLKKQAPNPTGKTHHGWWQITKIGVFTTLVGHESNPTIPCKKNVVGSPHGIPFLPAV